MNCKTCNNIKTTCICEENLLPNSKAIYTTRQKALTIVGKALAVIFALACGITTAGTLIALHFFTGGLTTYILAAVLFAATTATNIKMCNNAVPEVLIDIFGKGRFMAGLTQTTEGKRLSIGKLLTMGVGILLALSAGVTFAGLSYSSVFALTTAFTFLGAISTAFPPIAITLAAVTFVCLTALMLKSIANIIKTENLGKKFKLALKDLVNTHPDLPRNQGKSRFRIITERLVTVVLVGLALPLAGIGLVMMMNNCTQGLGNILLKIPHGIPSLVHVASDAISLGFALAGQIPFVFRTAFLTMSNIFNTPARPSISNHAEKPSLPRRIAKLTANSCLQILRALNAVGNGVVAIAGAGHSHISMSLAGAGGFENSFAAATDDSQDNSQIPKPIEIKQKNKSLLPHENKPSLATNLFGLFKVSTKAKEIVDTSSRKLKRNMSCNF